MGTRHISIEGLIWNSLDLIRCYIGYEAGAFILESMPLQEESTGWSCLVVKNMHTALVEDPSLFPSTHMRQLATCP